MFLGAVALLAGAAVGPSAHAAFQTAPATRVLLPAPESRLAQVTWQSIEQSGLRCRSSLDGSNVSTVRQVRAQLGATANFSHIVTTFWPGEGGNHELTMMFRVGNGADAGVVREARALIDPATCTAHLLSIS